MANPVVTQKLDSIVRCLERIELKRPASLAALEKDPDAQDILMLNLERLVQLSVDVAGILIAERAFRPVPSTMAESFDVLCANGVIDEALKTRMRKAVGFRNIAVHEYDKVSWEVVFLIVTKHLEDFKAFARVAEAFSSSIPPA